jgi:hypothetical protein
MDDTPVDVRPFLKKGPHYAVAEFLYRHIFQHLDNLLDRISARYTRKWCEDNSVQLRVMNHHDEHIAPYLKR